MNTSAQNKAKPKSIIFSKKLKYSIWKEEEVGPSFFVRDQIAIQYCGTAIQA